MKIFTKNLIALAAALAVIATAAPGAHAQFGGGGFPGGGGFDGGGFGGRGGATTTPAPWASFKLNPKVHITLDFRNASVDAVMSVLSKASGIPIIKDPSLKTPITLMSPKPLPLDDAFALFNAELQTVNFELQKQDHFLIIKPSQGGSGRNAGGGFASPPGGFPSGGFGGGGRNSNEIEVIQLKYADATNLATTINNLYAPTPGQNGPAFPVAGPGAPGAPVGGPGGFGGRGRGRFGGFNAASGGQNNQPTVKASADAYSNSLVINAPGAQQAEIRRIVEEIDKPTTSPLETRVFKLQYAVASDVESVVQNVLNSSQPLGRGNGSLSNSNRPGGFFGGGPGGFFARLAAAGSSQNPGGTVSAYTNTNALIVTATQDNMSVVEDIVKQLDQPASYQSTTFVYVLKNARADVVANVLNQAVGNRTTNGSEGGSLTNTGPSQGTINVTSTGNGGAGGIGGTSPTSLTGNTGGYRGGGAGGFNNNYGISSSNNMQNTATSGLDANGHVVNIRNLYGQVLFVPNIDTNSIIVVAPPDDQTLVKNILEEMDVIPEQVMIETLVVEVSLTKADQFGVEWSFLNNKPFGIHGATGSGSQTFGGGNGSTTTLQGTTTAPQGLRYTLTAPQFSVFLNALKSDTKFNVLSTPRIFTTNNATAQINISQSLPYVTNQTVDTTGTILYNYNFLDVGIVLTVTPRITQDGYVTMDVSQTANDFVNYTSFNAPIVNQRETQTTVSVKDGETIVLGGIISDQVSDTVNKVPILGDIPLIGNLFRSTNKSDEKTELLVFLTPHVVRDPADADKIRDDTEAELGKTTQEMIPKAATPTSSSHNSDTPATPASDNSTGPSTGNNAPPASQAIDPSAATATAPAATPAAADPAAQPAPATASPAGASSSGTPAGASSSTPPKSSSSAPAAGAPSPGLPGTTMPGATGAKALPPPSQINVTVTNPNK